MSSNAGTQDSNTGTPAASGGAGGAAGGQSATDSNAAGTSGGTNGAGGADGKRSSALVDGDPDKSGDAGASGKEGDGQGQRGAEGEKPKGSEGELEVKLPDGAQIDAAVLETFKGVAKDAAKEAGLDMAAASKFASKLAAWQLEQQAKAVADQVAAWEKQDDGWAAELKNDPAIGGDKLKATQVAATRAVRFFGGQPLVDDLIAHGIGNLPSLVRAFAKIGAGMAEDQTTSGGSGGAGQPAKLSREEKAVAFYKKIQPKAQA